MEKTTVTAEEFYRDHFLAHSTDLKDTHIIHSIPDMISFAKEYASLLTKEKDRKVEMWKDYYAGASMLVEELQSKLTRLKEEIEVINIANIMSAEILNEQEAKLTSLKEELETYKVLNEDKKVEIKLLKDQADRMAEALKDIMNYTSEGKSYNTAEAALKEYRGND